MTTPDPTAKHALPVLDSFERPDICAPCGGKCCQSMPGTATPADVGAPDEPTMRVRLRSLLGTGRWAIDWWEGDPRPREDQPFDEDGNLEWPDVSAYYLRPATVGQEGDVFDASFGGRCTFHTSSGCAIFDTRPEGCRALEPATDGGPCVDRRTGSKQGGAVAWWPYREMLRDVGSEVRDGR